MQIEMQLGTQTQTQREKYKYVLADQSTEGARREKMWVKNCAVTPSIPPPSLSELYKILTFSKVEKYLRSARFKSFPSAAEMNICVATHPKLLDGEQSLVSNARHIRRGLLNDRWPSDVRDFRGSCVLLRDVVHPVSLTSLPSSAPAHPCPLPQLILSSHGCTSF